MLGGLDVDELLEHPDAATFGIRPEQIELRGDAESFALFVFRGDTGVKKAVLFRGAGLPIAQCVTGPPATSCKHRSV